MKGAENGTRNPVILRKSHRAYMIERILQELEAINNRVENLERIAASKNMDFLSYSTPEMFLPDQQLIDTYFIVISKGQCNASQVAQLTGRSRALESSYLNQLFRDGWIDKIKTPKTTLFFPLQSAY